MFGDSLYYDRKKGIGRAIQNVQIIDTTQKITISGAYAKYWELEEKSVVTGNTMLMQVYETDTLFLHADTLKAMASPLKKGIVKNKAATDSTKTKGNKQLYAYHHVKFYKSDMQGKCDSMYYSLNDSLMKLIGKPILWSADNQLTSDSIHLTTGKKSLKKLELFGTGFIVSEADSSHFNQIKGKYMEGFFSDNKLVRVNVEGNGQTIYYATEKNKETKLDELKAANKADCSDLTIYLKDNQINKITFITKPDATLFPIEQVDIKEFKLKGFSWRLNERPNNFVDIFNW